MAPPQLDSDYCRVHDPENADAVQESRRLGGLRRKREATVAIAYDYEGLESVSQIRRLLDVAAIDTLGEPTSLNRAKALGYIVQVAATLLEKGEIADKVDAIAEALGPRLVKDQTRRGRHR